MNEARGMSDEEIYEINVRIREEFHAGRLCIIASEPVLAREWLTPEEDAAWAELSTPKKAEVE